MTSELSVRLCSAGNFHSGESTTQVSFSVNQTRTFYFFGVLGKSTTWAPLASVSVSLVCNGSTIFSFSTAGTHETTAVLNNGDSCSYVVTGFARAEGSFGDNSTVSYDTYFTSDY